MSYLFVQILYLMHLQYTVCKSSKISDKQILREIVFYSFFFEIDTKYTCDKNFVKVTFLIRKGVMYLNWFTIYSKYVEFTEFLLNNKKSNVFTLWILNLCNFTNLGYNQKLKWQLYENWFHEKFLILPHCPLLILDQVGWISQSSLGHAKGMPSGKRKFLPTK